jgi:hypothetical protein
MLASLPRVTLCIYEHALLCHALDMLETGSLLDGSSPAVLCHDCALGSAVSCSRCAKGKLITGLQLVVPGSIQQGLEAPAALPRQRWQRDQ